MSMTDIRNNSDVRELVCEVAASLALCRKNKLPPLQKIKPEHDFQQITIQENLKSPSAHYGRHLAKKDDPLDIYIPFNELIYCLRPETRDITKALYWVSWILKYASRYKKEQKLDLKCNFRNNVYIEDDARQVSISTRPARIENSYVNANATSNAYFIVAMTADIQVGYTTTVGGVDYGVTAVENNTPSGGLMRVSTAGASFISGSTYTFVYESPYSNYWQFGSDGVLSGPSMGSLVVNGIGNNPAYELGLYSSKEIILQSSDGEFLHDSTSPGNQIATIDDLPSGSTGSFTSQDNKTITVTNGIITGIA
jgi:hypothetical protein